MIYLRRSTFRKTTASRLKYLLRRSCCDTTFLLWGGTVLILAFGLGPVVMLFSIPPLEETVLSIDILVWCLEAFGDLTLAGKGHAFAVLSEISLSASASVSSSVSVPVSPSVTPGVERQMVSICETGGPFLEDVELDPSAPVLLTLVPCPGIISGVLLAMAFFFPYNRSMSIEGPSTRKWSLIIIWNVRYLRGFSKNTRKANWAAWPARLTNRTA